MHIHLYKAYKNTGDRGDCKAKVNDKEVPILCSAEEGYIDVFLEAVSFCVVKTCPLLVIFSLLNCMSLVSSGTLTQVCTVHVGLPDPCLVCPRSMPSACSCWHSQIQLYIGWSFSIYFVNPDFFPSSISVFLPCCCYTPYQILWAQVWKSVLLSQDISVVLLLPWGTIEIVIPAMPWDRNLRVIIGSFLSHIQHINSHQFFSQNVSQVWLILSNSIATALIQELRITHLKYCNSFPSVLSLT